jgi:nitrogenase-associated protein
MATVIFFEKPGCGNNTKQKVWLAASGHTVLAKNLLTEKWSEKNLRQFFGELPVAQWFNQSAPMVKSGVVIPAELDEETALALMLDEPLLIHRPLMEAEGVFRVGFDADDVRAWIGLNEAKPGDPEACPVCRRSEPCPTSEPPSPQSSPASVRGSKRERPCSTLEEHNHA